MTASSKNHSRGAGAGARTASAAARNEVAILSVSSHLTDRDREVVRLVARHRMLTTDQLAALSFGSLTTARHRLSVLVRLGVLRRFRPHREVGSAPWHYVLGPVGAALLGQEDRDEKKWVPQVRADRQLALERSQRLGHMTGASWFFVALARHARHASAELLRWDSEREATEFLYQYPGLGSLPHPDGMGIWAEGGRDIAFLLEYDTGTEHLPQLAGKLLGYADLARDPGGQAFRIPILFCFPTARREQTARNALAATRASRDLQIATAALDPRVTSPAGRVWMPLHDDHGQMRLIDLVDVLSDPWLRYRQEEARKRREAAERDQAAYLDDQDDEDFGIAR
jgi:DNA-binding CsgD family transcriptional regulator